MLKNKIQEDLKKALLNKEELAVLVLRMTLASFHNREIEKKAKLRKGGQPEEQVNKEGELNDEEMTQAILSDIKKRKEAILEFEKGKRQDLAEKEKKEMEILQKYIPEQISEEKIKELAKEAVAKTGAKEMKNMGKVMAELAPQIRGRADGGIVSKIVKELLSGIKN